MATEATLEVVKKASLGNKGVVVSVSEGDDILGHLMIGKASPVWFEKNAKARGRKVSWADFREWMLTKAEQKAKRPSS